MKIEDNYPSGNILWFNDFYFEDNKIIFSVGNFNGLYKYNINEKNLEFIGNFKNENILMKQLYGKVHRYKDKLVFTPLGAENIGIYDLKSGMFESILLPFPKVSCGFEGKFLNSVIYDNKLFLFPGRVPYIAEYNFEKEKLIIHDNWYGEYNNKWGKKSSLLFGYDMVIIRDEIFLPSAHHNGLFRYCLKENMYEFIEIPCECKNIFTLAYDGEYFWCSTNNGKLLKLNVNGRISEEIDIFSTYGVKGIFAYSVYDDGYLWLFLSQTSIVVKISSDDFVKDFEIIRYSQEEKEYTNLEYNTINFIKKMNNRIFFMSRCNREIKCICNAAIENYLEHIMDTTEYIETNIETEDVYKAFIHYTERGNFYRHEKYEIALVEQTKSSETLNFLLNEIKKFEKKQVNNVFFDNGFNIFKRCLQGDRIT